MPDPNDVIANLVASMTPSGAPALAGSLRGQSLLQQQQQNQTSVPSPDLTIGQQSPQPGQQPDLSAMSALMAATGGPPRVQGGTGPIDKSQPPSLSGRRPNIVNLVQGLIDPRKGTPAGERVPSRSDVFENFLGNFLQSFSSGLQAAGHGPGANLRGLGGAIQAPYQQDVRQFALQQQAAQQQSEMERTRAQTRQIESMGDIVQTPLGPMSKSLAMRILPAYVTGQAKVEATKIAKRYIPTQFGLFDTESKQMIAATNGAITVTPDIAHDFNIPEQLIGKQVPLGQFSQLERGGAAQWTTVQGAQGPALVNKGKGTARDLGLGNPHQVANDIAAGRLKLSQMQFERDTFGTLFGKAIPSSLVDTSGKTIGWKSPASPTQNIKQQAQQAQDLEILFNDVGSEIKRLQKMGKLGPVSGRFNEYMTGRVGADDPDFAKLRALGSLTASGMLKAHFGARGGQEMYKHFEDLFNTGRMTANDLLGAMDGFKVFMHQYAARVKTAGDVGPAGSANKESNVPVYDVNGKRIK